MRLTGWLYYKYDDIEVAKKLRADLERLAKKYELDKLNIGDHLQDGQCSNCGQMTEILFTENCGNDTIRLCGECDKRFMALQLEAERTRFNMFKEGRG